MHVLYTTRAHDSGEEVLTSYGPRSNVLLFRTYGFTLHPSEEPSWGYVVQRDRPQDIFDKYLPPERSKLAINLETWQLEDSLVSALHACRSFGKDPADFLRELCCHCVEPYTRDVALKPALNALEQVRMADPTSAAWWEFQPSLPDENGPLGVSWAVSALRVKMSEYLCLVAHLEAVDFASGRLPAGKCFANAAHLREYLSGAFAMLAAGKTFTLVAAECGGAADIDCQRAPSTAQ